MDVYRCVFTVLVFTVKPDCTLRITSASYNVLCNMDNLQVNVCVDSHGEINFFALFT